MPTIRKLPPVLVNQIAAGEVIERPASVVKELIENSLDAGATRIEVTLEQGGTQLIRVHDDGHGMTGDSLTLALTPHATSKITESEDLESIGTLGFRGEALASIASVARVRITSRPAEQPDADATTIRSEGGSESPPQPCAAPGGTTIEIRDLFFNVPARRKFLRTPGTEYGHCHDAFVRTAMAHPHVHWTLHHNTRTALDLPAASREDRCLAILGNDLAEGLLTFDSPAPPHGDVSVWGLAGMPDIARPTARQQYVYVNGRPVRDRNLGHAIREAYRGLLANDRHPVVIVMVDLPADKVDVNVHPTKAEVRFHEPSAVHGAVLSTIRQRLLGTDLTAPASLERTLAGWSGSPPQPGSSTLSLGTQDASASSEPVRAFVDYFKQMEPVQRRMVMQEVERIEPRAETRPEEPHDHAPLQDGRAYGKSTPILQVHGSYVVTEDDEGLVIVDQHALHERVMFETLLDRVLGEEKPLETQRMLMPVTVAAEPGEIDLLNDLAPLLARVGMEIEPIGPRAVGVHAFPSLLVSRKVEPEPFVRSLLDLAASGKLKADDATAEESALHEVLDLMACKAAVKAGDQLSAEELSSLLEQRDKVERSSRCPHGRPTTLRLSLRDLERQFGRS
ncbi:DNA mismatch repair endonuclease MutL [Mucisphaera calidilacus]|uniref:DNA mismatch repair protein MutL n=1 Tax=Mucisphaera calidilacus TaxID=2527982 RepID=A0A518BW36_9BACT|nr:DNA mismatch repair endonuclease MutL [Mucisphaera calidilacus]QDU71134.1 DNA mismatch repair protein MutL [Mucisphaera calidilacus]